MTMTNEEKLTALYDKMTAEQDTYRDWLKKQSPEEILHHTYEYTVREDIVMAMEDLKLTDAQADALLSSPSPLADVYDRFLDFETGYMDVIRDAVESRADTAVRLCWEKEQVPLYCHGADYAGEHGELDAYRASCMANIACKEAIEMAIHDSYQDHRLNADGAAEVVSRFGLERVEYVLAATIQRKDWDGRFSHNNKEWAKSIPVQENKDTWRKDRSLDFVISQAHPGLIDLFANQVRRQKKELSKDRPSVLTQLQKKPPARHTQKKKQEPER